MPRTLEEKHTPALTRPAFRSPEITFQQLHQAALTLRTLFAWKVRDSQALDCLADDLAEAAREPQTPENEQVNERVRVLIRNTDVLFPLVVAVEWNVREDGSEDGLFRRLDGSGLSHNYPANEVDRRTRSQVIRGRAYLKARYRNSQQVPRDRMNRPLYLYPAPCCPVFSCTCLIVEGKSDAAFFETLLDRIEPDWRAIQSECHPQHCAIEIRQDGGATNIAEIFRRTREEGRFHSNDLALDGGSERIVVVVDSDHVDQLSIDEHILRARHELPCGPTSNECPMQLSRRH